LKKYTYILLVLLICSCNYFENKKIHANDTLVQEKMDQLDKTSIDKFPVFIDCESLNGNTEEEKECFITTLSTHISDSLWENQLVLTNEIDASFQVTLEVAADGKINIIKFDVPSVLKENIPNIEQLISESVQELPEIKPALKKVQSGELIAVKTQFVIPIRVVGQLPTSDSSH